MDYRQRAFRGARHLLHMLGKERWSSMAVRLRWRYIGHRARNGQSLNPGCAGKLSMFRLLSWWTQQQGISTGARHHRRHYPRLMGLARGAG